MADGGTDKPPFTYPGAKVRIAPWIIDQLPEHQLYCEPFSGSAAVFFAKEPSPREVLNDRNEHLVHFLTTLRDQPEELRDYLEQTPYSRGVFEDARDRFFGEDPLPEDDVERAAEFYYLLEVGYTANVMRPNGFSRESPRPWLGMVEQYHNKVDRLPALAERLRDACIERLDYRECITTYDDEDVVFYCDPPYYGRQTSYGAEDFSHGELADAVTGIEADVLVSYDDLPPAFVDLVEDGGWSVLEKTVRQTVANRDDGDNPDVQERLVVNFDAEAASGFSGAGQRTLDGWAQ